MKPTAPATKAPVKIPAPPPANAVWATLTEAAGFYRVSLSKVKLLRRTRPDFPKARLMGDGAPRFRISELDAWGLAQPQGWSTSGGPRRRGAAAATPEHHEEQAQ